MVKGKNNKRKWLLTGSDEPPQNAYTPAVVKKLNLGPKALAEYEAEQAMKKRQEWEDMSQSTRNKMHVLAELFDDDGFNPEEALAQGIPTLDNILDGSARAELSHAGGDLDQHGNQQDDDDGMFEEGIEEDHRQRSHRKDWRTRRDRTIRRTDAFKIQMRYMATAYSKYTAGEPLPESRAGDLPETFNVLVIDLFEARQETVVLPVGSGGYASALLRIGLVPCAPWKPSVVITARVLDMYRHSLIHSDSLRSPRRESSSLHMCFQFSIAYDVYLELRRSIDNRVLQHLGRDGPAWRMKNCCPACTYKLEGEDDLIFGMLVTMDGNDSLKRVLRRKVDGGDDPGDPNDRPDNRDAGDGYYLPREQVDAWAKRRLANILPSDDNGQENPCKEKWKNMTNDITSRMWGIFDETGIFLCLCRHGFALVVVDMLRSGELSKYPLAVVEWLLEHLGIKLGVGYDIGCHFCTTLKNSELGPAAEAAQLRMLVGAFHGHAHNRLCQVCFLALYIKGLGIEDLEGCERAFSKTNGLAGCCRRASRFHRQQEITAFLKHQDTFETYSSLSKFLCSNYEQALKIIEEEPIVRKLMLEEDVIDGAEFERALAEEKEYLTELWKTSKKAGETTETRYVSCLETFDALKLRAGECRVVARRSRGDDSAFTPGRTKAEIELRHAEERMDRAAAVLEGLELELGVLERWKEDDPRFVEAQKQAREFRYQQALDRLELLVVERLFELTKVNQSGTGYKMRTHVAKSLQARSKAVRTAVDRYNAAAAAVIPPKAPLNIEQVLEYTFVADFDLLRHSTHDVEGRTWSRPAFRSVMNRYFRIERAREEIKRLDIEIRRFVTWMQDERAFLLTREAALRRTDGKTEDAVEADRVLAFHIAEYRHRRGRFDALHMSRLQQLERRLGGRFTGSLEPGKAVNGVEADVSDIDMLEVEEEDRLLLADEGYMEEDHGSEDEGDDAHDEQVSEMIYQLAGLGVDTDQREEASVDLY
ncbi:hypothetical protein FB45DRAFT_1041458 [Roridomyces roridus]|uniref:CxC1-like cysteine cluster associated with KDZ transposases domain-containing protein n=1 Tax=Roridomyces roridus TaxID=1738132 RepID=A0AAD7B0G6_9AGAR|nr:hypothetical protein FB45DRAFT_1041458 [Roridomyces roridus]